MNLDLTGKHAVVCGSTQGIGRASAIELALLGASVTLLARNETKLQETLAMLSTHAGQRHQYIAADFSHYADLEEKIKRHHDANIVHILVNNTGGPAPGPAMDASANDFVQAFASHVLCSQLLVQTYAPSMKQARYGRIINIISTSVKMPIRGLGVSNTIRGAVANWAKTISAELAPFGITVNNVLPGTTMTGRLQAIIETKAQQTGKSIQQVTQDMIAEVPAGRISEPHEVAAIVAFLASPAAGYVNGINVPVDGGRTGCL